MLYVERDPDGKIVSISKSKTPAATEIKPAVDDEVIEFLDTVQDPADPRALLTLTDAGLVRAFEDLINVLVDKKVIRFTDLPPAVQKKVAARQKIRQKLSGTSLMVNDIL
ncbi:MAG TPA: hypothetical protein ENF48_03615 [Desulfobacteraceae bacterium]|nr:hypothetical protein [Deltaproteobacteria bacterium]MBW2356021.1 hypothetical protein [Deltaproteobacteria bacterium]RLB98933.1 MAG: hypothetical protein DRH76_01250 [Deltaproteobacteria bacterium]HDI59438.1 hypothetical protein [Desulfobacteraceae bacterium]